MTYFLLGQWQFTLDSQEYCFEPENELEKRQGNTLKRIEAGQIKGHKLKPSQTQNIFSH